MSKVPFFKDVNLQLNCADAPVLKKLEKLCLSGPLGCDVARYLLKSSNFDKKCYFLRFLLNRFVLWGATEVRSLYLGIEWILWLQQPSSA